ncbi:MAG: hypothetical protein AAF351_06535 [Pseudomonadota bacterium]
MGVDKIVKLVGVIVAIVAAFVSFDYSGAVVAILGIAGGWFIAKEERSRFLIAAVALGVAHGGLNAIPGVGEHITTALGGLSGLFMAGAATVVVLGVVDALKP